MATFKYGRWDDTQEPFPARPEDLMDAISDDLTSHGDINRALRRMMQRGFQTPDGRNVEGLRQMMERLRKRRQEHLDQYNLNSVMEGITENLKEIQDLERNTLAQRLQEAQEALQREPDDDSSARSAAQSESAQPQEGDGQDSSERPASRQATEEELAEFLKKLDEELERARDERERQQEGDQEDGQQNSGDESGQQSGQGQQLDGGRRSRPGQMDAATAGALEKMAARKMDFMESLPQDPGGVMRELSEYDFMDEEARQKFQELMDSLRQQAMQSYMQNMMQQMENITPEQMAATKEMLRDLKALGVRISMDDFGTGYSSLATLEAFPFDKIKIDRSFVWQIGVTSKGGAIVRAILSLGESLDIPVIAEGVETEGQLAFLRQHGCAEIQGYLRGKPQPIASYRALVGPDRDLKVA
jgi:hypothetical protein